MLLQFRHGHYLSNFKHSHVHPSQLGAESRFYCSFQLSSQLITIQLILSFFGYRPVYADFWPMSNKIWYFSSAFMLIHLPYDSNAVQIAQRNVHNLETIIEALLRALQCDDDLTQIINKKRIQ